MNYTVEQYLKGHKVSGQTLENAKRTVAFVNDCKASVPHLVITSTVRTPAENKRVGGVANSKHLVSSALAVDFRIHNLNATDKAKIKAVAANHGFGYLEHDVKTGNHIHCEFRGQSNPKKKK